MTNHERPQPSPSREILRRHMAGRDGIARGAKEDASADAEDTTGILPIGSIAYPPCQCPRCKSAHA